jgi:hypothetical protein
VGPLHAWFQRVEPFAYGALGLRPWELPLYTLREFGQLVDGWRAQDEREHYRVAELACWLLSPWVTRGRQLTPRQLLGRDRREEI